MLDTKWNQTEFSFLLIESFDLTSRRFRSSSRRLAISRFCRCSSSSCWGFNDDADKEFWRFDGGDGDVSDKAADELCFDELRNVGSFEWLPFVSLKISIRIFLDFQVPDWLTFELINGLVWLHLLVFLLLVLYTIFPKLKIESI